MSNVDPDARIIAIADIGGKIMVYDSLDGQVHDPSQLPLIIMNGPGGFIAGLNLYPHIAACQSAHASTPGFVAQVTSTKRAMVRGPKRMVIGVFLPNMVGFRDPNRHRKARYFQCMEFGELFGGDVGRDVPSVLATARAVLSLLAKRGVLQWTASKGGIAARMLKASPEWELKRHGAPRFINALAREHMPGNHYGLGARISETIPRAIYLDQDGAHHAAAMSVPIPHPHFIRERGAASALANGSIREWCHADSDLLAELQASHYGLFACLLTIGNVPNALLHMVPKWMREPGTRVVYLHSNEWWYLGLTWVTLNYVCAAWTATVRDPAIVEYAEWASGAAKDFRAFKPTLLAAYGMLAVKSDNVSTTYWGGPGVAERGLKTTIPVAGPMRELTWMRDEGAPGPATANVIGRGIIEAETRSRSLSYAWELHGMGIRVVSVYVDGLMIEADQAPLPRPGWSVKSELTRLRFLAPNSYVSQEEEKLPGIPRDALDRRRSARSLPVLVERDRIRDLTNA